MFTQHFDLACFTYLAHGQVLRIDQYPQPNTGAEVSEVFEAIVADGAVISIGLAQMGFCTALVANDLGNDPVGMKILNQLREKKIASTVRGNATIKTPSIIVLTDNDGNREWFAHLPHAKEQLMHVDLSILHRAELVYVDLYPIIELPGLRAIDFANAANKSVYLNLGERPMTKDLLQLLGDRDIKFAQISIPETQLNTAEERVRVLLDTLNCDTIIATLGAKGAVALTNSTLVRAKALAVDVLNTSCAGAAFSAGFLYGHLNNWDLDQSLQFGCALGSFSCTISSGFSHFNYHRIIDFISRLGSVR